MKQLLQIRSDHGLGPDMVAFTVDSDDGSVVEMTVDESFGEMPKKFDVEEFKRHYGKLDTYIDVLDIGFELESGVLVQPEADHRLTIMRALYFDACKNLAEVTASLENCAEGQGETVRNRIAEARAFLIKNGHWD